MNEATDTADAATERSTDQAAREPQTAQSQLSLPGRVTALFLTLLVLMALVAAWAQRLQLPPLLLFLSLLVLALPLGAWLINRQLRPVRELVQAVSDGIASARDGDYSIRLAVTRRDELGQLVQRYNEVIEALREERSNLRQRELLLETALERSPVAVVLVHHGGRVVYANPEARKLFLGGRALEGLSFPTLIRGCPTELQQAMAQAGDSLFSIDRDGEIETLHLSHRALRINQQGHDLVLLRRLTAELGREEARIWKKVIRVISHELNNSLAPVSSLVHSAGVAAGLPAKQHRVPQILEGLSQRLEHLRSFLEGYARFARLPRPRKELLAWNPFLERVQQLHPCRVSVLPVDARSSFDPAQMEQVLINLLANASEASREKARGKADPELRLELLPQGQCRLEVLDRGGGMSAETLRQALLPFYSTKKEGSGLGLPLCREIIEGHGGTIRIANRRGGGTVVTCLLPQA